MEYRGSGHCSWSQRPHDAEAAELESPDGPSMDRFTYPPRCSRRDLRKGTFFRKDTLLKSRWDCRLTHEGNMGRMDTAVVNSNSDPLFDLFPLLMTWRCKEMKREFVPQGVCDTRIHNHCLNECK